MLIDNDVLSNDKEKHLNPSISIFEKAQKLPVAREKDIEKKNNEKIKLYYYYYFLN